MTGKGRVEAEFGVGEERWYMTTETERNATRQRLCESKAALCEASWPRKESIRREEDPAGHLDGYIDRHLSQRGEHGVKLRHSSH